MKRKFLLLVALVATAVGARAQYYTASSAPWTGDKLFSLTVGSLYTTLPEASDYGTYVEGSHTLPFAIGLHYDGEKAIGERFVYGFINDVQLRHFGYTLRHDGDNMMGGAYATNQWLDAKSEYNRLAIEARTALGFYITEELEVLLGVGLYTTLYENMRKEVSLINKESGHLDQKFEQDPVNTLFELSTGVCGLLGMHYYLNDQVFLRADFQYLHPLSLMGVVQDDTPTYMLTLGVGYRFIQ